MECKVLMFKTKYVSMNYIIKYAVWNTFRVTYIVPDVYII